MINLCGKSRTTKLLLGGCGTLLLFLAACGQKTPPDTRATDANTLRDLDSQWSKAAGAHDVDKAVSFYTDDASLLPPNAPAATGIQAIRSVWTGLLASGSAVSWEPDKVEVARSSDLAYTMGSYESTMKDAQGKPVADRGKYVAVWKKQADGKWKAVADIFNSDLPVAPPPAVQGKKARAKAKGHARATRRKKRR